MRTPTLAAIAFSLVFTAGGLAAEPPADDSLTLEQAIRLTLVNQPAIEQAEHAVTASAARVGISRSSLYPDVSLLGSYTRVGPVPSIDMGGESMRLAPENAYDVHVGLRHVLYDFGKTSTSIRAVEATRQAAADNVVLVKSHLAYRTIGVFNAILILRQTIVVVDEQIEVLRQHLDVSTKRIIAGTATDFDTLTTQVRIAVATSDRIDALRALETQEVVFRQLTGLPQGRPVFLTGTFAAIGLMPNRDSLLSSVEKQRPELVLAEDAENSAAVYAELASLGDKPLLSLNLTSGFKDGYVPDLHKPKANFTAGLQFHVPIFNGRRTIHEEAEAAANLGAARAHTSDVRRWVVSEVEQAVTGVKSSLEKIASSDVQVRQAEKALSMARTRYEAGVVTNLDLLDAETTLSQVKLIRLRALYDYTVSLNALDQATGKRVW
jgi:outer membrane protein